MPKHKEPEQSWESLTGMSERIFLARMKDGFAPSITGTLEPSSGQSFYLLIENDQIDHLPHFTYDCHITPNDDLYIQYARKFSGNGRVTSKLHKSLLEMARPLGVKRIRLFAAMTGAYHWARAGFHPKASDWILSSMRYTIRTRLKEANKHITPQTYKTVSRALKSWNPKAIWTIVDQTEQVGGQKLGYYLLNHVSWSGYCDLEDPECLTRFRAHANEQPVPLIKPRSTFETVCKIGIRFTATQAFSLALRTTPLALQSERILPLREAHFIPARLNF